MKLRSDPFSAIPLTGINSVAFLLPRVIVPVLSSKTALTSPAASTALPLNAITLCCNKSIHTSYTNSR